MQHTKNYTRFFFNLFLLKITSKKNYIQRLKNKLYLSSYYMIKKSNNNMLNKNIFNNFLILYILDFFFSKTNILLHVTTSTGKLKFFCSAGNLFFKGKNKKGRTLVLKNLVNIIIKKIKFLKNRPIVLRLKNVGFKKVWIIKKLKKKTFIKIFTGFNLYSYNGCRKKKIRRL